MRKSDWQAIFQNQHRSVGVIRISANDLTTHKALVRKAGIPGILVDAVGSSAK